MGVRTRRGRFAQHSYLWQAPLRTPLRAGLTLVLLVAAVAVLANLGSGSSTPTGAPAPSTSATSTAPPAPAYTGTPVGPTAPGTTAPQPSPTAVPPLTTPDVVDPGAPRATAGDPAATAVAWARAFLDHRSAQQWIDGLQPLTTQEQLGQLGTVDVSQVPDGQVLGAPTITSQGTDSATVLVPTSAVRLQLGVVRTPDGWRVGSADQAP